MAYDEKLAERVRVLLTGNADIAEKKMFGGLAFLLNGNMSVGVHGAELIVRTDPTATEALLKEAGVRIFDMTGRPMKGWLLVSPDAVTDKKSLARWVNQGLSYAKTLPPK